MSQASPTSPASQTRVSIYVTAGAVTGCATTGIYSFDLSNSALASAYEATLLTAIAGNLQVTIGGSGVCDAYGIEEVASVYLYSAP